MKPKDLVCPYSDLGRAVHLDLNEQILFVPSRTERPQINLDFSQIFEYGQAPVYLEVCSGNGEWIVQQAIDHPDVNWIALEMRFDRVRKIWSKMKNHSLNNLFILCGEALDISTHYLKEESLDALFVNFPDPWPKARHAKHRLIQSPFVEEVSRLLKSEGSASLLTDDQVYSEQIRETFIQNPKFESQIPAPYYSEDIENYGSSYFMRLWMEKKRSFYFSKFQKRAYTKA